MDRKKKTSGRKNTFCMLLPGFTLPVVLRIKTDSFSGGLNDLF
ncbi:MAG: hypothetical protein WBK97_04345 [Bacteroidales bacterium]|jgi:hypothetical protein